ncbi:MAG TPA: DUF402 domain-containing protein [Micromonosporaceae bacterium]
MSRIWSRTWPGPTDVLVPGRTVLRRQFQRDGLLSRVWAGTVVADDEHGLWLWVATGSTYLDIAAADGRSFREVPFPEWAGTEKVLRELVWRGDMVMLHPPGQAHSVWFFFAPDRTFRNWYVNLEQPSVRWDDGGLAGIDTIDYDLDLVIGPDRRWRWKDEDEFAEHLAYPQGYWVDDESAVWREGRRLVEIIEAGCFPFDHGTPARLRPDPTWPVVTTLSPGWDRPQARD